MHLSLLVYCLLLHIPLCHIYTRAHTTHAHTHHLLLTFLFHRFSAIIYCGSLVQVSLSQIVHNTLQTCQKTAYLLCIDEYYGRNKTKSTLWNSFPRQKVADKPLFKAQ